MSAIRSTAYYPPRPRTAFWIGAGFVAGAVSVLVFHQGAVALLNILELTERAPYSTAATYPFGLPLLASITLWGGAWGAAFAIMFRGLDGWRLVAASVLAGAVLPTLVAWFLEAPLKGQPVAADFESMAMAFNLIVNAAWGLGTGLGLVLFGRERRERARRGATDRRREGKDRREASPA